jgi:tetratricopeptide (TPR) repeat protein
MRYAPTVARYSFELALLLSAQGEHTQASQASWKAIELGYKLPESYNNYAYALAQAGQYQAAEKALKQAISYYTTSTLPAATLDTQGFLHLKQHRYHEALHLFDAALKQDAHLAEVYLHKAEALEALGLYKEAVENYRHYLRLTPASEQTTLVVQQLKRLEEASTSMTTPLQWPLNTPSPTDPALTPAGKGQTVGGAASVQSRHDE